MRRASGYGAQNQDYHHWNDNVASDYSQDDHVYSNQHTYSNQSQKQAASRNSAAKHGSDSRNIALSAPHRDQPSSIVRPGTTIPSRLPSALRAPRTRSYTSSSSTNSHTTAEEPPPLPQSSANHSQVSTGRTREDISTNSTSRAKTSISSHSQYQSGLPRRSASASRSSSRSRSRNDYSKPDSPPPLPESHSGSDGTREIEPPSTSFYDREKVPDAASWAKDRRRFANSEPSSGNGALRVPQTDAARVVRNYEQPTTQAPPERRSSLAPKPPLPPSSIGSSHISNRSRIPSAPAKPNYTSVENKTRNEPSSGSSRPKSSQIGHPRRPANSNIGSLDRSYESTAVTVAGDLSQGQRHRDAVEPKLKPSTPNERNSTDVIHISSMKDMPLPTPLFPQSDLVPKNRRTMDNRSPEDTRPRTISSPLETMLMGSNPGSTPNTKRVSSLMRSGQEPSTHVPAAPTTPRARRYSEPSPGGGNQSSRTPVRDQTPKEQEAPPTILQRLVRRASFSAGKSPKPNNNTPKSPRGVGTPKNQAEVEHYDAESPFELDVDTPRATTDSGTGSSGRLGGGLGVPQKDLSQRQRRRQSGFGHPAAPPASTSGKKPRSKAIDNIAGAQDGVDKLGSPFMGDGSPRFGIDERFKSPRARSKSGLRNDVSSEAREDDPQDLFDYYTSDDTGGNDEDHFLEDTPVATVLASPGNSGHGGTTKSPIPPSPMARSKKRSHYQHAGGIYSNPAELVNAENRSHSKPPGNDSLHTPRDRTPSRVTFSPVAPDTVREGTRSSSQSSGRSQFSDLPMGREPVLGPSSRSGSRRQHGEMSKPGENVRTLTSPARPKLRHSQRDSEHTTSDSAYTQPSAPEPVSIQSRKDRTFHRVTSENGRAGNHNSQLPVPKARKTNSALFRALEQPYDSSPYSSNPSTDVSLNSLQSDSYDVENDQTDDSIGQLHTVPSNLSSLNGDKVGDIRWSGTHELSRATDVLFHNISHSDSGIGGPQVVIEEPSDAYLSDANDVFTEPAYSDGAEYKYNRPGLPQRLVEHPGSPSLEEGGRRMSMQDKRKAIHESWRASLEGSQFGQPEGTFDPMELERQRAIWEFHESEEAYVDKLQLALRLFVQPLRTQNQRQWISGLASDVMRLFDWLDDIANLHHQLLSALDTLRMKNQSFLIGFSDSIRPFIPLMELYQPYVVRVEEVGKHIMAMALDPDSDFGEFIRMQSALPDCDQESLEDMLAKPAKRLQDYVDMFQRILTLTPRAHPDYLATFSLLHAMHAMTCVIQEVKSQEEEYRVVKSLLNRVRGLPHGFMIAARGRRLLAQGVLQQVHLPGNIEVCHPGPPNMIGRARSGSQSTTISSTTDSTGSLGRSTSSSTARLQDSSTEYSLRSDSSATSYMNTSRDSRKPNRVSFLPHVGAIPPPQTSRSWSRTTSELGRPPDLETVDVYILVFADFVFLAKPVEQTPHSSKSPRRTGPQAWSVLDAVGTFRVLDVTDTSQHGYDHLISLDLFPVDGESKGVQILPMVFRIPNSSRGDHKTDLEVSRARREWLDSFNECYLHTLRSVSFASDSEDTSTLSDPYNTLRYSSNSSVVDTLSGGFDFPKSPSQQLDHGTHLKQHGLPLVENAEGEREEREFWAERFKSVFRQLRRTYKGLPLPPLSPRTGGIYEQNLPLHNMTKTCRSSGTMI